MGDIFKLDKPWQCISIITKFKTFDFVVAD